jgi:hypothetical protein
LRTKTPPEKWEQIALRHTVAVRRFLEAGAELSPAQWQTPIAAGKWTPEQITQHVIQTYDVLTRQLRTGEGLRVQTGWFLRQVLRSVVLRAIMWTRRLPPGAKAARALMPTGVEIGKAEMLEQLRTLAAAFEDELQVRRNDEGLHLTHHLFGSIDALRGLDFVAVHTEHHGRQLSRQSRRTVSA